MSFKGQTGFIRTIILIILALILLSYVGVDVAGVLKSDEVREAIRTMWRTSTTFYREYMVPAWTEYIKDGLFVVWNRLIDGILFDNLKDIVQP